jgi:hypothetical protein
MGEGETRMDGCWQPWLLGCVIDWQAWGAIATVAAVGAALLISGAERRDRRRTDRQEAKIIATAVLHDLDAQVVRLAPAVEIFGDRNLMDSTYIPMLIEDQQTAAELSNILNNIHLPRIERMLERLHVLPVYLSAKLLRVMEAAQTAQILHRELERLRREDPHSDRNPQLVEKLGESVLLLNEVIGDAAAACINS